MVRFAIYALLFLYPFFTNAQEQSLHSKSKTFKGVEISINEKENGYILSFTQGNDKKVKRKSLSKKYIKRSWITDLDTDHNPETVILLHSTDSGDYRGLDIYEFTDKSLKSYNLPQLPFLVKDRYRGRDTVKIIGKKIVRSLPLYHQSDDDCCPDGGKATIKYELKSRSIIHSALDVHENVELHLNDQYN